MAVPYTFGTATSSIPLSQLDSNFATGITLGNTTVYLGNTTTSFGNVTLTNVTISSVSTAITPAQGGTGLVTIPANNVILGNGTSNVTVVAPGTSGNVLTSNGTTWSSSTISAASVSAAGSTTQVQYNNGGAFAGSANLTFNGTTLTAAGLSGPHNGTVGATTPSTGAFTTLAASSTVSGTGFSTYLASPPAIGGTAPAAGAFTTLTATTAIGTSSGGTGLSSFTSGGVVYASSSSALATGSGLSYIGTALNVVGTNANIAIDGGGVGGIGNVLGVVGTSHGYVGTNTSTPLVFNTGNTERMRLDTSGNLGIGTSSPATQLHVVGNITASATNPSFYAKANNSGVASFYTQNAAGVDHWRIFSAMGASGEQGSLIIRNVVGTSNVLYLDTAGNLGIGAASAGNKLQVSNGGANGFEVDPNSSSGTETKLLSINRTTSAYTPLNYDASLHKFLVSGGEKARIDASGNLLVGATASGQPDANYFMARDASGFQANIGHATGTASGQPYVYMVYGGLAIGSITQTGTAAVLYNTTSDYRLKTVVGAITGQGSRIDALKPIDYQWKDGNVPARGFLAHDFQEVYPNSVTGTKDAVDSDGKPVYQAMQAATSEVIADLVAEIQSLRQRLSAANL